MRLALLLLVLQCPVVALAAEPVARLAVEEDGRIVPGQQVHLRVDVLVADFFTSPPVLPPLDVPNAVVSLSSERRQNFVETIADVQYSGIRSRYAIVPETDGSFEIPSFEIGVAYSEGGVARSAAIRTEPVHFEVGKPPGSGVSPAFAARGLTIGQTFDRDPASLKTGDALVRTIVIFALDTQAMIIPPVEVGSVPGLRSYRKDPAIEDGVPQGRDSGSRRTETITYVAERPGAFELPAVAYPWFDVDAHRAATASLPATALTVTAKAAAAGIAPRPDEKAHAPSPRWRLPALIAAALLAAGAVAAAGFGFVRRRASRPPSRRRRLNDLRRTILTAPDAAVYDALAKWSASNGYSTIEAWASDGDDELRRQTSRLASRLFGGAAVPVDRKALSRSVGAAGRHRQASKPSLLPPLNPRPAGR